MKRALDIIVAIAGLIVLTVLAPIIALLVKLDSEGAVLFRQRRIGKQGAPFWCYKFRTMFASAPERPTHEVPESNVTRVGRFLRVTKLDELPQVLNVLRGDMSVVGPRPCLDTQHLLIERRRSLGVLQVSPGITGLAQVRGIDMSDPVRLAQVDAEYIRRMSIMFDLKIIYATVVRSAGRML